MGPFLAYSNMGDALTRTGQAGKDAQEANLGETMGLRNPLLVGLFVLFASVAHAQPPLTVPLVIQEALTDDPGQPGFQLLPGVERLQEPATFGIPLPAGSGICG